MTDPFAHPTPPRPSTLDAAYRLFHNGSLPYGAALNKMVAAGLLCAEARAALDAPSLPSVGVLAVAG
jgi:hypothetical protein